MRKLHPRSLLAAPASRCLGHGWSVHVLISDFSHYTSLNVDVHVPLSCGLYVRSTDVHGLPFGFASIPCSAKTKTGMRHTFGAPWGCSQGTSMGQRIMPRLVHGDKACQSKTDRVRLRRRAELPSEGTTALTISSQAWAPCGVGLLVCLFRI